MPATFRHFAINADDVSRAKQFYESVFAWRFDPWGPPDYYQVNNAGAGLKGALQERREFAPGMRMRGCETTFGVADLKATIAAIEAGGGRIVMPPFRIESVGELIYFEDTEGNILGAMQYDDGAPSPTGFLHIGGARTALFNWLFARHHGGRFLLRIEDTDRVRSTPEAMHALVEGLKWLELHWDGEIVHQFERAQRHAEVARQLLAEGKAYHCYASPQELDEMRAKAKAEGRSMRYDGRWRDRDPKDAPQGVKPVIRLKARQTGETVIKDAVQGDVRIGNDQLDDMVLLRADGTPVYMLAVVVDDQDMGVTHVIRGDDHLNNAARQMQLIEALGWPVPAYAHIPLIHGPDGAKLSKRHGALAVDEYRKMGYLPEAMRNYLLRLGWSHGDDEIISTEQAIKWFDLDAIGRSAARFDFVKLGNLNGHYIKQTDDARLVDLILPDVEAAIGRKVDDIGRQRLAHGMAGLKPRAKTLVELAKVAAFYVQPRPLAMDDAAKKQLGPEAKTRLAGLIPLLKDQGDWTAQAIEARVREAATAAGIKLGDLAQPLRAALTGQAASPPIFEVMAVLGREETLGRLADIVNV